MVRATIVCVLLGLLSAVPTAAPVVSLGHPGFHASGQGEVTTTGSIAAGESLLTVANADTWAVQHGIRVRRAGDDAPVHNADAGWTLPPTAPAGASVTHDSGDAMEGAASVKCAFAGVAPGPVELCEVDLGAPANFFYDEVRLWLKSSMAISAGALRLRLLRFDDPLSDKDCAAPIVAGRCPTFDLDLPAVAADVWQELFVELKRTTGNGIVDNFSGGEQVVVLECRSTCDGIEVHLDDLWLVKDFVAVITGIEAPGTFTVSRLAGRTVTAETVYHDDTVAVLNWLKQVDLLGEARLVAPAGIYYISLDDLPGVGGAEGSRSLWLYNNTHLRCASRRNSVFKNTGRSATGPGVMFRSADESPATITIENCGFDWNGWNLQDFATVFLIAPHTDLEALGRNIVFRGNRFFDSQLPGMQGCDFGQDECRTRQRHHILVPRVDGVWIERNVMSGGGRIKTGGGGLGRNMHITNNALQFVNDNAITIVDTSPGVTELVEIVDNTIVDPVVSGIFFGGDGEEASTVEGMAVRDLVIAGNRIYGFFATAGIIGRLPRTAERITIDDNIISNARQSDVRPGLQFVSGIILAQQSPEAAPATDFRVARNRIIASGPHAIIDIGGIVFRGAVGYSDLDISDNDVECSGCPIHLRLDALGFGIRLWSGTFNRVSVTGNRVVSASEALRIGEFAIVSDGLIERNDFTASKNQFNGQITVLASAGQSIAARVANNDITDGAGYGILCSGEGQIVLTGLLTNNLANNAAGAIGNCVVDAEQLRKD